MGPYRGLLVSACLVAAAGCGHRMHPGEAAATWVAQDMLSLAPEDVADVPGRFVMGIWGGSTPSETVPERVISASGLPSRTTIPPSPRDSTIVALDLFKPRVFGQDSVLVHAEWLVFPAGPNTLWGNDYDYVLRCRLVCELIERHGPGTLN